MIPGHLKRLLESGGEAKVANFDGHVPVQEHVAQLQVAVQHLLQMEVPKQYSSLIPESMKMIGCL